MRPTDLTPLARGGGAGKDVQVQTRELTARAVVLLAPASTTEDMIVMCDAGPPNGTVVKAGHWAARGTVLPATGAVCCVTFDSQGDAWVGSHWSDVAGGS